jgi:hypothetical protein
MKRLSVINAVAFIFLILGATPARSQPTYEDLAKTIATCEGYDLDEMSSSEDLDTLLKRVMYISAAFEFDRFSGLMGGSLGGVKCDARAKKLVVPVSASPEQPFETDISRGTGDYESLYFIGDDNLYMNFEKNESVIYGSLVKITLSSQQEMKLLSSKGEVIKLQPGWKMTSEGLEAKAKVEKLYASIIHGHSYGFSEERTGCKISLAVSLGHDANGPYLYNGQVSIQRGRLADAECQEVTPDEKFKKSGAVFKVGERKLGEP